MDDKTLKSLAKLGSLMGDGDEDRIYEKFKLKFKLNSGISKEELKTDLTTGTVDERQNKLIDVCKQSLWTFDNCDLVECDHTLINNNMLEMMWKNLNAYSYDIETFFINRCNFKLKEGDRLVYNMFFKIEDNNSIFLYVEDEYKNTLVSGTIAVITGMFHSFGAISDKYYPLFRKGCLEEGLVGDREFVANRTLMNCLLYIIIVNQMVNMNREIITETSKRVEISNKKKPSKKKKGTPKKTQQIRYIKVDVEKVQRIKREYEKTERESYDRHVSEWSKRGHWRHFKDGSKTWIKPTQCHAQVKVGDRVQKIYKVR